MTTQQRRRRDQAAFNPALVATDAIAQTTAPSSGDDREEEIAMRAYELYEQRGGEDGHAWDDWFQAERELRRRPRED